MTEPILGNKEWKDRTLEGKVERLLRVHDHNALELAEVGQQAKNMEADMHTIKPALDRLWARVDEMESKMDKFQERVHYVTDYQSRMLLRLTTLELAAKGKLNIDEIALDAFRQNREEKEDRKDKA